MLNTLYRSRTHTPEPRLTLGLLKERGAAILGAGLAGLTAAKLLHESCIPFTIYEGSDRISGMAGTDCDDEGFTYDFGSHFITNRFAHTLGISAVCRDMAQYGEAVYINNKYRSYPLGLLKDARYLAGAIKAQVTRSARTSPAANAAEWYRREYGESFAREIAIPLTQAWSGEPCINLSSAVGSKFTTSPLKTLLLKAAGKWTGRPVSIGYCSTLPDEVNVWHVYPQGGIKVICETLAENIKGSIKTNSRVDEIFVEDDRVTGIRVNGVEKAYPLVISSAPVHTLSRLVTGTDRLHHLSAFAYRAMIFVNLKFKGPVGLPEVLTWFPGRQFKFFRLSDIGLGSPWLVPSGKSLVTADIGCAVGDKDWLASDSDLAESCLASLERLFPSISERFEGARVMRSSTAYPLFRLQYEQERQRWMEGTGVDGLVSVGRNGEFSHLLMEDVYWRTRMQIERLVEGLPA